MLIDLTINGDLKNLKENDIIIAKNVTGKAKFYIISKDEFLSETNTKIHNLETKLEQAEQDNNRLREENANFKAEINEKLKQIAKLVGESR